ncbi:hypothetical protein [Propionivibrio soli]|uniref:hypothetical protein n=1 Tax=Propionivibrio soli TaxID=2976531 RepID=UPI0021E703BB|nr:hypothetical protein [Propionivibrio soli]
MYRAPRLWGGRRFLGGVATLASLAAYQLSGTAVAAAINPLDLSIEPVPSSPVPAETRSSDQTSLEAWLQGYTWRNADRSASEPAPDRQARVALDYRRDWRLSSQWRASVSDRLESARGLNDSWRETHHMLREAYLTWNNDSGGKNDTSDGAAGGRTELFVDVGRINQRLGVATGYNPTDYFRGGAVVSTTSQNPATLRQNRLGTVATRAQWVTAGQSLSFSWVPRLSHRDTPDDGDFALGLERTNREEAFLFRWSPRVDERFSLDVPLLMRGSRLETGTNATLLVGDALVFAFEASVAKRESLPEVRQAMAGLSSGEQRYTRAAFGATWTAESGISLTLERHHAGDALSRDAWASWRSTLRGPERSAAAAHLGELMAGVGYRRDLLVRDMWFARVAWDDAFQKKGLDLSVFTRVNAYDHSRSWQAEGTWNDVRDWSLRLIVGGNEGSQLSEYGSSRQRRYGAVSLIFYW